MIALSYELGEVIEPSAKNVHGRLNPLWPWLIVLWRCPHAYVHDAQSQRWQVVSSAGRMPDALGHLPPLPTDTQLASLIEPASALRSVFAIDHELYYKQSIARAVEYIHAGDIFQVNLAHRLGGDLSGSVRGFFSRMLRRASPGFGAYLEVHGGTEHHTDYHNAHFAASISPELFLSFDPRSRELVTRPIKGTMPGSASSAELRESAKNQAELNMIVDLMRNDLGRVAEVGSVKVRSPRDIERHAASSNNPDDPAGVLHAVATVSATLRRGLGFSDVLRATFPAGSITGAPKVRAMQIINELHGRARGLYTGAVGYVSDDGHFCLNVAIRTAMILDQRDRRPPRSRPIDQVEHAALHFPVGAGIVADSIPESEWLETLDKARALTDLTDRPG